jgi:hypothetical protein
MICLASERLSHDLSIGRIIHQRGGAGLLLGGRNRPHLRLRLVQQGSQEGKQVGCLVPEHLICLMQHSRPDPDLDRATLAQLQDRAPRR